MPKKRRGFTLVELMIVMVIIAILITFILKAAWGGIRTAEIKATISLVSKLEQAMTDRVEALQTYRATPTPAHLTLAAIFNGTNARIESAQRAQAIAQIDYMRAQMPDVFMVTTNTNYPLNFAGQPFGGTTDFNFQLPFGNSVAQTLGGSWRSLPTPADPVTPGTGIYGAAYEVAGGIYKQLGYGPKGYNGNDDDFDGLVDESDEGMFGLSATEQTAITTRLAKHTHKTARAEMLYAILVEGGGTYGSAFDKDDFTSKEVQDTDGDGLMEFVDAWGEPLQFYRWPVLYRSDSQKGYPDTAKLTQDLANGQTPGPYSTAYEAREQNPIDPNQTLLAPAWWGSTYNNSTVYTGAAGAMSGSAITVQAHFGPLSDPTAASHGGPAAATTVGTTFWDRSTIASPGSTGPLWPRRAFYSRFLILSAGPDKIPGTAQLGVNYASIDDRASIDIPGGGPSGGRDSSGAAVGLSITNLLVESQGGKVDLNRTTPYLGLSTFGTAGRNDTNSQLEYYSQDDITSQNLEITGGVLQ